MGGPRNLATAKISYRLLEDERFSGPVESLSDLKLLAVVPSEYVPFGVSHDKQKFTFSLAFTEQPEVRPSKTYVLNEVPSRDFW